MANGSAQFVFPMADWSRLQRAMDRAGTELRKSAASRLKWAAYSLAVTLGTSSKVAKRVIDLKKLTAAEAKAKGISRAKGQSVYTGTKYFNGRKKDVNIIARGIREARQNGLAKVFRAGILKQSWKFALRGLGSQNAIRIGQPVDGKTVQKAMAKSVSDKQLKGDDMHITIGTKLNYALDAMIGGQAGVNGAVSRAAKMMEHQIDGILAKKAKEMAR